MKTSCHRLRSAVLLSLILVAVISAHAQITPSQDAYTNTAVPTTNFGAATTLGVANAATSIQTSYIQFDLSSIPGGYTGDNVAKATLKLYVNSVPAAGNFNVVYVNGAWGEKTINNNNVPALGSTIQASVPLTAANKGTYLEIDITSALQAWLNGAQPNDGIALVANSPLSTTFDSKENTGQSHPPEMDVVFNGAITGITTASGSGLTGGTASGTANLSLLKSCSSGQTLIWNGSVWACKTPSGSGTVTSVGLSAPVSDFTVGGSPVTGAGTLALGWNIAPTSANSANAIVKRDATGSFNASNITASGQITVSNGTSLNPISVTATAANAAAIVGGSMGTGLTDGVLGASFSSGQGSAGVIGLDQNSSGSAGRYTTGVTGFTQNSFGVGVLGYGGVLSNSLSSFIGLYQVGAWGDDAAGAGIVATSDTGNAEIAVNASTTNPTLIAQNNAGNNSAGSAVKAVNISATNPTLLAQNNTVNPYGVVLRAAAPNVQSNGASAFCQVTAHGDMGCTGDVYQNSPANGLVKALLYFDPTQPVGSQIVRCFNSTVLEPTASTPPCNFKQPTHLGVGANQFDFQFAVNNRFIQVTAVLNASDGHPVVASVYSPPPGPTQVNVYTFYTNTDPDPTQGLSTDTPFYLTIF